MSHFLSLFSHDALWTWTVDCNNVDYYLDNSQSDVGLARCIQRREEGTNPKMHLKES
ncbi:hypothetical protein BDW62DRAFT_195056 [Aspergillus aurantiobrunneus]